MEAKAMARQCPACGEPAQPNWKICPLCETRLPSSICHQCNAPVEPAWKRCPACEAYLACPQCGKRLPAGTDTCPHCPSKSAIGELWIDKICGLEMILVEGAEFEMGDLFDEGIASEKPVHTVHLDAFYLSRTPVTQAQWSTLMSDNPSRFQGPDLPVEQVAYDDAVQFAHKLSDAYQNTYRFNLPTEAQWEFSARSGGQLQRYAGGDDIGAVAWYGDNSQGCTHPVGAKTANGLGLFDMSGNVWEWCLDSFAEDGYERHAGHNPLIDLPGNHRVIRGGSWNLDAWSARCARRFDFRADAVGPGLGFRIAMRPRD